MIPGCPKCGKAATKREETWSPPIFSFVYPCCGARRTYYHDALHGGWESEAERAKRLERTIVCEKCKKPFKISYASSSKGNDRSVCDHCFLLAEREVGERRKEVNRKKGTARGSYKHGCTKD